MREVQRPGNRAEVVRAMAWVIVLRSDPAFRSGERTWTGLTIDRLLFAATWNDIETNIAPMKEDLPWNRCC
jgi:hypothetical protein